MKKILTGLMLTVAIGLSIGADDSCGPTPTEAQFSEQRKMPFFKVLVYEHASLGAGDFVGFLLFEDESGNCYITSGTDGGITQLRDRTACDKAKAPALENR